MLANSFEVMISSSCLPESNESSASQTRSHVVVLH